MAEPGADFAEIAVALQLQARDLAWRAEDAEHAALSIGLFPVTAAHLLAERRRQALLVGAAHLFFKAMIPVEAEVKALLARSVAA